MFFSQYIQLFIILFFIYFFSIQQQYINWKDNIVKININLILEGLLGLGVLLI